MFDHIGLGVSDYEASKQFFLKALVSTRLMVRLCLRCTRSTERREVESAARALNRADVLRADPSAAAPV